MTLEQLAPGESGLVGAIEGRTPFRRRLLELGLMPGTVIERTGQAPLGDPLTFRVRGAVLCLRRAEARLVSIERAAAAAK